ncbi:MAG: hypothetical protein ACFE8L_09940 [Candidatus Hodarchaeota archaeon]
MSNFTSKICLIVILIYVNAFWIYDFVNSMWIQSGGNLWIPIIFIVAEVFIFVIYHYATKEYINKKWQKQDKNQII